MARKKKSIRHKIRGSKKDKAVYKKKIVAKLKEKGYVAEQKDGAVIVRAMTPAKADQRYRDAAFTVADDELKKLGR